VLAVVLTTWGGQATPQAKNITIGSLAVLAGVALFGIVCWLGGMLAESQSADAIAKLSAFLVGAGKLAVVGIGIWYAFTVFQGMRPAQPQPGQPQMQQGYYG